MSAIHDAMRREFPLMWDMAQEFDFAERLGGCANPLYAEVDAAMREIWNARQYVPQAAPTGEDPQADREKV